MVEFLIVSDSIITSYIHDSLNNEIEKGYIFGITATNKLNVYCFHRKGKIQGQDFTKISFKDTFYTVQKAVH